MPRRQLTEKSKYALISAFTMPILGFGTYDTEGKTVDAVDLAFKAGYRLFDTAFAYHNHGEVATGLAQQGVADRIEVFVTTKILPASGPNDVQRQIKEILNKMGFEYIDLVLLHSPHGRDNLILKAWDALVHAVDVGQVRSIGVSNFSVEHLNRLSKHIQKCHLRAPISVNQMELHPWSPHSDVVEWCETNDIVLQAYCPLVRAKKMDDTRLQGLAKKHGRTPAQILLRWSLQKGFVPLPKSTCSSRIRSNFQVFDFELDDVDMKLLEIPKEEQHSCSWNPTGVN